MPFRKDAGPHVPEFASTEHFILLTEKTSENGYYHFGYANR